MKSAQILRGLFEDAGRQIFLARLGWIIVEDQNMSNCFATYGDRPRQDREDFLRSSRCGIRQPVGSNHHHSFLTPSRIDISENFENLQTAEPPTHETTARQVTRMRGMNANHSQFWCLLTALAESKPNRRITKAKTIRVTLMASSIIEKKSQGRENRPEHRATDLRRRTRMTRPNLRWLNSSSRYFSQAFEDRYFTKI